MNLKVHTNNGFALVNTTPNFAKHFLSWIFYTTFCYNVRISAVVFDEIFDLRTKKDQPHCTALLMTISTSGFPSVFFRLRTAVGILISLYIVFFFFLFLSSPISNYYSVEVG